MAALVTEPINSRATTQEPPSERSFCAGCGCHAAAVEPFHVGVAFEIEKQACDPLCAMLQNNTATAIVGRQLLRAMQRELNGADGTQYRQVPICSGLAAGSSVPRLQHQHPSSSVYMLANYAVSAAGASLPAAAGAG